MFLKKDSSNNLKFIDIFTNDLPRNSEFLGFIGLSRNNLFAVVKVKRNGFPKTLTVVPCQIEFTDKTISIGLTISSKLAVSTINKGRIGVMNKYELKNKKT